MFYAMQRHQPPPRRHSHQHSTIRVEPSDHSAVGVNHQLVVIDNREGIEVVRVVDEGNASVMILLDPEALHCAVVLNLHGLSFLGRHDEHSTDIRHTVTNRSRSGMSLTVSRHR